MTTGSGHGPRSMHRPATTPAAASTSKHDMAGATGPRSREWGVVGLMRGMDMGDNGIGEVRPSQRVVSTRSPNPDE